MPTPKLKIPEPYQQGLQKLRDLSQDRVVELVNALRGEEPIHLSKPLAESIASKTSVAPAILLEVIPALAALVALRASLELSTELIVESVASELDRISEAAPEATARFKENLRVLLDLEDALPVASKALGVVTEHQRILGSARVVTDLRPIFRQDPGDKPAAAAIIHALRLAYHEDGRWKTFFVAMDDDDVRRLKLVLDRAEAKSKSLKAVAQAAGIPVLKTGGGF